jgi:hypothetical protein
MDFGAERRKIRKGMRQNCIHFIDSKTIIKQNDGSIN